MYNSCTVSFSTRLACAEYDTQYKNVWYYRQICVQYFRIIPAWTIKSAVDLLQSPQGLIESSVHKIIQTSRAQPPERGNEKWHINTHNALSYYWRSRMHSSIYKDFLLSSVCVCVCVVVCCSKGPNGVCSYLCRYLRVKEEVAEEQHVVVWIKCINVST